ncbi:MAG: hypothetical protein ACI9MS_001415, partial [Glaciecola sp.]
MLAINICQLFEYLTPVYLIYFPAGAHMKNTSSIIALAVLVSACSPDAQEELVKKEQAHREPIGWQVDFVDEFDSFITENWQDQMLWVNSEDQC